jgi:hypothetical protein
MNLAPGPGRFKMKFTLSDDIRLQEIVNQYGATNWQFVASHMIGRSPRQCRERWANYLNPVLASDPWTLAEEQLLDSKFAEFGPKWHLIAEFFPRRSRNQIKNHWRVFQKRKLPIRKLDEAKISEEKPLEESSNRDRFRPQLPSPSNLVFIESHHDEVCWDDIYAGLL